MIDVRIFFRESILVMIIHICFTHSHIDLSTVYSSRSRVRRRERNFKLSHGFEIEDY